MRDGALDVSLSGSGAPQIILIAWRKSTLFRHAFFYPIFYQSTREVFLLLPLFFLHFFSGEKVYFSNKISGNKVYFSGNGREKAYFIY